jgi:hypothetical protein
MGLYRELQRCCKVIYRVCRGTVSGMYGVMQRECAKYQVYINRVSECTVPVFVCLYERERVCVCEIG